MQSDTDKQKKERIEFRSFFQAVEKRSLSSSFPFSAVLITPKKVNPLLKKENSSIVKRFHSA